LGQERQWPWSTGGFHRPLAHTGTCSLMAHRRGRAFNGLLASSCFEFQMVKIQRPGATLRATGGARGGTPWGRSTSGHGAQAAPVTVVRLLTLAHADATARRRRQAKPAGFLTLALSVSN